jgi:hypothetical protein
MLGHGTIGSSPLSSLDDHHVERFIEGSQDGLAFSVRYADPVEYDVDVVVEFERTATTPLQPPLQAERLLNYVLPRARREEILGDLQEDYYTTWLPKFGPQEARRLYWLHTIRSIAPMLWTGVKRSGIITALLGAADWLRDRLG